MVIDRDLSRAFGDVIHAARQDIMRVLAKRM